MRLGGAMRSTCSIDLLGPRSGCWPHAGEVAGAPSPVLFSGLSSSGLDSGSGRCDGELAAVGAIRDDDDVGFGERRRWWRRRVAQRGSATYGVIDS